MPACWPFFDARVTVLAVTVSDILPRPLEGDPRRVGCYGRVMALLDLVGAPEIADMLEVTRRTAWRYIARSDFPEPVAEVSATRLWKRADVARWARRTLPLDRDPRGQRAE